MIDSQTQIEIAEDYKKRVNLSDLDLCMEIIDWWNTLVSKRLVKKKDLNMIQKVHKIIGNVVVDIIKTHSQSRNPIWEFFMDNEPLPYMLNPPSVGDLIEINGMIGVVKSITGEDIKKYKIHFTDGNSITMRDRRNKCIQ
tara:strand:+ start:9202 stop:9621 length:420 start_codon:yes stop_codon:yes gene_type:complete